MNAFAPNTMVPLLGERLYLELRPQQRCLVLHFNNEKTRNAVDPDLAKALALLCNALQNLNSAHPAAALIHAHIYSVLVLKSHTPGVFLSGGDLKAIISFDAQQGELFTSQMRSFTEFLRSGSLISIALLNGVAAGGGSEIALACDLRIATHSSARLDLAQTRWGVPAGWGMMTDLRRHGVFSSERRRGLAVATQESWDSTCLQNLGLLDACFDQCALPDEAFETWLKEWLGRLQQCPLELSKALVHERPRLPTEDLDEFDKKLFSQYWLGEVHRTRVADFIRSRRNSKEDSGAP
jgi:enoyl-CoA hydratase/carnithine racemase